MLLYPGLLVLLTIPELQHRLQSHTHQGVLSQLVQLQSAIFSRIQVPTMAHVDLQSLLTVSSNMWNNRTYVLH